VQKAREKHLGSESSLLPRPDLERRSWRTWP
jgi:hypothetical protein